MPEGALLNGAMAGDRAAFEALVERFGAEVLAVLQRQLADHHTVLDLAQEVWIKVHRALPGFRPGAAFRPWLLAIAFNALRDERRGHSRRESRVLPMDPNAEQWQQQASESTGSSEQLEERQVIEAALVGVPEPYRSAVHLVDVLELPYDEAAQSLDCAVGTLKSRVHRGRLAFRDRYRMLSGDKPKAPLRTSHEVQ